MNPHVKRVIGEDEDFARDLLHTSQGQTIYLLTVTADDGTLLVNEPFSDEKWAIGYLYEWIWRREQESSFGDEDEAAHDVITDVNRQVEFIDNYMARDRSFRYSIDPRPLNPNFNE